MTFNVDNIHFLGLEDNVLPSTGMTVAEAVFRGKTWWKKTGRDHFRRNRDRKVDGLKDDEQLKHDSGLMFGVTWEALSIREKVLITGKLYCEFIRNETGYVQEFDYDGDPIPFKVPVEELRKIEQLIYKRGKQSGG